jgi:hypothetical protein
VGPEREIAGKEFPHRSAALVCAVGAAFLYFFSNPDDRAVQLVQQDPGEFVLHDVFVRLPTGTRRN